MIRRIALLTGLFCVCSVPVLTSLGVSGLRQTVETYVQAHQHAIIAELIQLLSIPNHHSDQKNIRKNANLLREMLESRGFQAELLETQGNPLVYGELRVPGASRTTLLYIHYDGQPVDPSSWEQDDPFTPVLRDGRFEDGARKIEELDAVDTYDRDWRLYARSASDDKGPIVALCAAVDALRDAGLEPTSNLRVVLDGEEEGGGFGSLVPAIDTYREKLSADLMLIFDGPAHPSGKPTLVFGARGTVHVELTVYGPKFSLHSGHYGNWVPNPAMRLSQLLASMKDDDGQVLIEGFYDDLVSVNTREQAIIDGVPDDLPALMKLFGIAEPERRGLSLQQALQRPTLNIRGMASAYVGAEARTIIPDIAQVMIDIRLVKETRAKEMFQKVLAHIRKQGYHVVEEDPDVEIRARYPRIVKVRTRGGGTNAFRTSPLLPDSERVTAALTRAFGEVPVRIRTMGGTLPITPFIEALGFPAIVVPTVNFDNNQHSANENIRLGHFFDSIVSIAAVLMM